MKLFEGAEPRFISHRGFRPLAPDNSLPGFEYAGILKQWAIETDVHAAADGTLVCNHNKAIDATYNGTGLIKEMTWNELSKFRLNEGSRLECFTDEEKRMPLFSEYLAICKKYGCVPFIEMKTDDAELVLGAIREAGLEEDEVVISTSKLYRLEAVRAITDKVFVHWIFAEEGELSRLYALGNAGLSWNYPECRECPKEKIELAHSMNFKVCLRAGDTNCMHK